MKSLSFLVLCILVGGSAHGAEYFLNCRSDLEGVGTGIVYQAVKVVTPVKGRWVTSYKVRASGPNFPDGPVDFSLEPAGSGDEDYNDYDIVDARKLSGLQGASIQNRFEWVTLVDTEGYGAYRCFSEREE